MFASIQTLGRLHHLERFSPTSFDYIVDDEFHHAAAATYRRLIAYFQPKFLLGLTATPERTDGGDLLALCQQNLVYRSDLVQGIRRGLLCPFHYFGVPDEVDYRNIPWRSGKFDEEALTTAVATRARAGNALEQCRTRGGQRTLGFCVSQRHADFMAGYFSAEGVKAVAVHAGERSAPRAASLRQLSGGERDIGPQPRRRLAQMRDDEGRDLHQCPVPSRRRAGLVPREALARQPVTEFADGGSDPEDLFDGEPIGHVRGPMHNPAVTRPRSSGLA